MRGAAIGGSVVLVVVLSGCGPYAPEFLPQPTPDRDDLVDTWVHEYEGETATLELHDDGTLDYENLPDELVFNTGIEGTDYRVGEHDGTGSWDYDESATFLDGLSIDLVLDRPGDEPHYTRILVGNQLPFDDIILSYVVGDPDSAQRYRFYH
jgi:hypothetical protein